MNLQVTVSFEQKQVRGSTKEITWISYHNYNLRLKSHTNTFINLHSWKSRNNIKLHERSLHQWPRGAVWWRESGSTLAQARACCRSATRHYLNQRWLILWSILYSLATNIYSALQLSGKWWLLNTTCLNITFGIAWRYWVANVGSDLSFHTLRPRQRGRHFADDTFRHISLNEDVRNSIEISMNFVPKEPINHIPALVQIMAWRRPGDMPLSEPIMVRISMHMCVTRPQAVNS